MTTMGPAPFPLPFALKNLILEQLPNLENVWNEDPHGILSMQFLEQVSIDNCKCLTSVFPASVTKNLKKLKDLIMKHCEGLMAIVAEDNADREGTNLELTLPGVTSLTLWDLPTFKYNSICSIHDATTFELIPNLRHLKLGENELKMIWHGEFQENLSHKLKILTLCFYNECNVFPYEILEQVPNVEKLVVCSGSFKEIFCLQSPNVDHTGLLSQLKALRLESLPELLSIGSDNFWIESFLRNLHTLEVISCFSSINLVPYTVSFSNLTYLEVESCNSLLYLFKSSTAKSLAKLKRLEIKLCDSIEEIVSKEERESNKNEIIFGQLNCLNLEYLPKLRSFYKGSLNFPSLDELSVIDCDMVETLCPGTIKADKLFEVKLKRWSDAIELEMDLNSTMRKEFLARISESAQSVSDLNLKDSPLQEIWRGSLPIPDSCFSNLDSLIVDGCQFLSDIVLPFNLLPFLRKLKTLEVRNCSSVKTIFDVKGITQDRKMTFALKELTLSELPNLENVWNEDPHGILSMQLLEQVSIDNCKCLTSVFPASVAKDLKKLEDLVMKHSEGLMAIVAEDNADREGTNLELKYPRVKSLTLWDLPKFKYNGICWIHDATTFEPTPNLRHLTLGENEMEMIWHGEFQGNLLHKLEVLTLCFHIESDIFPYGFLQQVPNIEKLVVCSGSFKEIFCFQSPYVDGTGLLSQLKALRLESLPELVSIGLENSWIEPFLRNLQILEIISCFCSINLVPCTVSFSNLTYLEVDSCNSLLYLFTSSTAKSLAQLKKMEITNCESIKEIVSKEGDESDEDEIIFPQLNCLNLDNLPSLRRFYKGSLSFPSLEQLSIINCHRMKTLCPGTIKTDKLFKVKFQLRSDAIPLEIDLKSTMQKEFLARIPKTARSVSHLELRESPDLQEIWHGSVPIPVLCFGKLHSLIVDGCQFLSDVVLPFNLLPFLSKLETLQVRNCDSVKTIFDVKCITKDRIRTTMGPAHSPLPFVLKKLILEQLPNLENVWNEDPHGILSMQLVQQVYVDNCKCLTSVFPASVAEDLVKLEDLVVQHCEGLMAIVAEDNADQRGTNLELTFPCMTSLTLWGLPKFEYQVCIEKLTPNLEELALGENEVKLIWHGEFQGNLLLKLKVLILLNFHVESNVFALGFLQQVPNIEKLEVSCGSFREIFYFQSPNVDDTGLLSQMKVLSLESLSELETIGLDNTFIEPFLRNLETLDVSRCSGLRNLASSPVCFSNLMCLFLFECNGLENLFTSSTAKSLGRLKIMEIKSCESIKEIVSKEGDGSHEDEIIFWQLLYLNLESLPNLKSFYRGSLSFPSLVQMSVIKCHSMETLCAGTVNADKLFGVKFQKNSNATLLDIDLNSTIRKTFQATVPASASHHLGSSSSYIMKTRNMVKD